MEASLVGRIVNYTLQVRFRTSLGKVLKYLVPVFVIFLLISVYLAFHITEREVAANYEARMLAGTRSGEQVARVKFQITKDELLFFSRLSATRGMARALAGGGVDESTGVAIEDWIRNFNDVAFQYANAKERILQIRIILANESADEFVKLKRPPRGVLKRIPEDELQSKAGYPYMASVRDLPLNEVYWSLIELNLEHGQVEMPPQPTIRGATPMADDKGQIWAYLVINYDAALILQDLTRTFTAQPNIRLYGYKPNGHYILHPKPGLAFQDQLQPDKAMTYDQEFVLSNPGWRSAPQLLLATSQVDGSQDIVLLSRPEPYETYTNNERGNFAIHIPLWRFQEIVSENSWRIIVRVWAGALLIFALLGLVMTRVVRQRDLAEALGLQGESGRAESDALISLMLQKLPVAMAMFDANMHYLAVSERWCQEYGVHAKDLIGKDHKSLFPHMRNAVRTLYQQALEGRSADVTQRLVDEVGDEVSVRWRIEPWHAVDGSVAGIVVLSYRVEDY
jgi:PAS domain S-box-containing protein